MNRFLKLSLLISALTAIGFCAQAQQYPVFSQYYFNELVINPAFAGSHVQLSMNTTYRNQWVNFPGAPQTLSFTAHSSFYKGRVGAGMLLNNDKIGSYNNQNLYGYYAYKIKLNTGVLSMGLQGGFNFLKVNFSKIDLVDVTDPSFTATNDFKPNFGAGVFYNTQNYFVGLSVPFLLNNAAADGLENAISQIQEARYYFLRGGVLLPLNSDRTIKLNPNILIRAQEGQPLSIDLNGGIIFYDAISTGVSWRSGDAFIGFVDFKISEKFHFAYSYDLTSSGIRTFSNGSHEFMINYRAKVTKSQKGLPCPAYYHYGILEPVKVKRSKRFNTRKGK